MSDNIKKQKRIIAEESRHTGLAALPHRNIHINEQSIFKKSWIKSGRKLARQKQAHFNKGCGEFHEKNIRNDDQKAAF